MKMFYCFVLLILFTSCVPEPAPGPAPIEEDNTKTNTELFAIKWIVDEAYVDGTTPDGSSKGLIVDVHEFNNYTLIQKNGNTYDGTWAFIENETKIELDKGTQFFQTWTIQELSETKLDVTFVSPFTGQNAQWILIPN